MIMSIIIFIIIIISVVTLLEAFHYLQVEQIFIFCSFFGKWFKGHFWRNTELIHAVVPLLHCLSFKFGTPPHPKSLLLFAVIF